ncbi:MAG TPA: secondary thiamine-phosphate synthase enzyme YjbQ [Candidatus Limnocylindrales bacterium]
MTVYHATTLVHFPLHKPGFEDVTAAAVEAVAASGVQNGLLTVYSQHTTCAVLIQEEAMDQTLDGVELLLQDMVNGLTTLFPTCLHEGQYLHPGPKHLAYATDHGEEGWWSLNTDAHLRSVMLGRSQSIPVIDGKLELGEFGRIYFADFDGVRQRDRKARFTVMGE